MNFRQIIYFVIIIAIIFISFLLYSSLFYPLLNSDNAVTILMIHYFNLPDDFYFWGQDRMGSIIPLIGKVFCKLFNFSALTSESITHYLLLVLGFFSFSHFLKSNFLKVIFAIVWFFPPMRLIDVTQFSFGIHYSLIAMSCYLFDYYQKEKTQENFLLRHSLLLLITLLLISAIWVTEMAIVTVFLLISVQLLFFLKTNKFTFSIFKKIELYYAIVGVLLGYLFIHYAKNTSHYKNDYTSFGDFNTISQTLIIFITSIVDFFTFHANEPFTSVYAYFVVIIFILIGVQIKNIKLSNSSKKWVLFFLFDAIILFGIIIISKWTLLNGVPRRYFTCTYISLSFALLVVLDNLQTKKKQTQLINSIILITVLIGGFGTFYNIKYIWPKTIKPRVELAAEFEKLGKIGIISEYWNSYIVSCTNPNIIKATPHDLTGAVRNQEIVDLVFEQKKLYVIRDMWMETFPDTLEQFGYLLLKGGRPFHLGGCDVCKYDKLKFNKSFTLSKLKYNYSQVILDSVERKQALYVSSDCNSCKEQFILYGPYISLGIGEFEVSFNIKSNHFINNNPIAMIDVVANGGITKLAEQTINKNNFTSEGYINIDLEFTTSKRYNSIEFRIYYNGNANLYFNQVEIHEK